MVVGVIGPTILDLALVLDKTLTDVSFLVMTRPLGTSLGAILSPLCCRRMNPFLFLFAVTLLSGVSLVATPFSRDVYLTSFFLGLAGLGTGLLSTGSNIYMLDMWSDKALPWLQATYGLLGVGALVAPLISAPFLLETPANDDDQGAPGGISNSSTSVLAAAEGTNETQVHYAYVIIGGFTILTSLTFLVQWMCVGNYKFSGRIAHRDSKKARIENSDAVDLREERNRRILKVLIIMTACFFFFVLVYSEVGLVLMPIKQHYADLVVPFAHYSDLQMPKKEAANINSFYWAAYTAARLASAVLAIKMGPFKTLLIEFVIGTIGTLLLLFFANHSVTWLWIGSGLLAIGRAAIYAAGIAHLERYIFITPVIFGLFVVFSAGGEAIVSWVVARNLETRPMDMMYAETAANFIMIFTFAVLYRLLNVYREKYHRSPRPESPSSGAEMTGKRSPEVRTNS